MSESHSEPLAATPADVSSTATSQQAPSVRIRVDLSYDGGPFDGWARQPGRETVQGSVEAALSMLIRREVRTVVAGRTDAGVHARGQVLHFDVTQQEWLQIGGGRPESPDKVLERRLAGVLARVLGADRRQRGLAEVPGAIVVRHVNRAADGFDARFSAVARRYTYRIHDGAGGHDPLTRNSSWWIREELDVDVMRAAAAAIPGLHDFLSFCKPRAGATTVREVRDINVQRTAEGVIEVQIEADAFCHNMVRSLVGATVRVGKGERPVEWMGERLAEKQRSSDMLLAPPQGLVLEQVLYPDDVELAARAEQTRARRDSPVT
ncbi:tRNA pseudouridine(38-40) synthase TruA [Kocuria sp.]|uniref:tRNA pseudouridine(38-40) synthase TruA n=1 Tax=Kocuria sp. TaxID=1871328 RepID=UPI003F8D7351